MPAQTPEAGAWPRPAADAPCPCGRSAGSKGRVLRFSDCCGPCLPLDDTHAEVAFVARSRDASGRVTRRVEHSRFVREGGRWFYVDGRIG